MSFRHKVECDFGRLFFRVCERAKAKGQRVAKPLPHTAAMASLLYPPRMGINFIRVTTTAGALPCFPEGRSDALQFVNLGPPISRIGYPRYQEEEEKNFFLLCNHSRSFLFFFFFLRCSIADPRACEGGVTL